MTDMTLDPSEPRSDQPVVVDVDDNLELPASGTPEAAFAWAAAVAAPTTSLRQRLDDTFAGMSAIVVKELRSRMRGRRAFVNVTAFLVIVGGFAWMVELIGERSVAFSISTANQSADIGRGVFSALVMLETFLLVLLAPAFTAGAISLEREKQTIDLLVVTPISSVAIVLGKLISALVFVAVLIGASIPFTAMVFVFGGVAPDDVIRSYAVLTITAVGFSSLGIFFSALVKRTQTATVVTYLAVIAITFGAFFVWIFWNAMTNNGFDRFGPLSGRAPEALLYPNPAFAQADVLCGTESGFGGGWCSIVSSITNEPLFGGGWEEPARPMPAPGVGVGGFDTDGRVVFVDGADGVVEVVPFEGGPDVAPVEPFGPVRDTFWPRTSAVWLVGSVLLVLAAIKLVAPGRGLRLRLPRPSIPRRPGRSPD
jgi:ABC-type transport system involved in multi-copper enzyme maturation permease subunit